MLRIYIAVANAQHLLEHASINLPFIGYVTTGRESGKVVSGKLLLLPKLCVLDVVCSQLHTAQRQTWNRKSGEHHWRFSVLADINLCFLCAAIISSRLLFVLPT